MSLLCPFQKSKDIASFYLAEAIVVTILECQYSLDQEHTPNGSSVNSLCGGKRQETPMSKLSPWEGRVSPLFKIKSSYPLSHTIFVMIRL